MDVRQLIGANVRKYRLAADLSQEAVAVKMGVDRAYISALELGKTNPTAVTVARVAEVLKIRISALFDEDDGLRAPSARQRARKRP
jgi:transcriptional regulator with XRE-family HTH domain